MYFRSRKVTKPAKSERKTRHKNLLDKKKKQQLVYFLLLLFGRALTATLFHAKNCSVDWNSILSFYVLSSSDKGLRRGLFGFSVFCFVKHLNKYSNQVATSS
jgi:hypothetical protein